MKIIITGATGLAGSEVLNEALSDSSIEQVTVLSRSPLEQSHPKLRKIVLSDFLDYTSITNELQAHDACLWCLGVSQLQVSKEDYIKITFDYAMNAAKTFFSMNPNLRFCFLSGRAADQNEKTLTLFGKIKGRTEKELQKLSKNVYNFRPAAIIPSKEGLKRLKPLRRFAFLIFSFIAFFLDRFTEDFSISSKQLAQAMIDVAKNGAENPILENMHIRKIAREK